MTILAHSKVSIATSQLLIVRNPLGPVQGFDLNFSQRVVCDPLRVTKVSTSTSRNVRIRHDRGFVLTSTLLNM